ncbi:MAG: arcB 3 [Bacteroidetes bacterium]|nr:arcB 3 [Bacteroidota bacterium]
MFKAPSIQASNVDEFNSEIKKRSDRAINFFLIGFFLFGLVLAPFYDTWMVAIGIGGMSLIAYYSAKMLLPKSYLYQYILGAVFGIFMAQYIYQMHGLFEMHFIAFIGSAMLITYQKWKLQIPLAIVVVVHHAAFAYMQYVGFEKVYFTQLDYMSLQTFIIHALLAVVIFCICGLWAYQFKAFTRLSIAQSFEIGRLQEEERKKEQLMQAEAEIKVLNDSLEVKVKERTSQLETVNKELEAFSYSVAHDLRAPLRVINGFSKMILKMEEAKISKISSENLHIIMKNAAQMGQLIDDLLDFSRLGRQSIDIKAVDMNDIVNNVIKEIKTDELTVTPEIHIQDLSGPKCDPTLMKLVWTNLISNAVKYSRKKDKPLIEIGITHRNGSTTYFVKDNGAGFDMQFSDKLFAVFQRLHKVTEYEGTGVGLALAQRIIAKHQGQIWADAKVDEGATFYFTLPNN